MIPETRVSLLLPSFLVGTLKILGPLFAFPLARQFANEYGKDREAFLPFAYDWRDERPGAQEVALQRLRDRKDREHIPVPRVFHAPYLAKRFAPARYWRNLADPRTVRSHSDALQRECRFLGRLRKEFGIAERVTYVVHLGFRGDRRVDDALRTAVAALEPALPVAQEAGVILAIENVAERFGGTEYVGATLPEIEDAIGMLGGGTNADAPVGWTWDFTHALLAYNGDVPAVKRAAVPLLSSLVHLHINAPHRHKGNDRWGDRHEAPTEQDEDVWELLRLACTSRRFQDFRTITYEVLWATALLRPLIGGSHLEAVIHGHQLVRTVAAQALGGIDAQEPLPYTADAPKPAPSTLSGSPEPVLGT